MTKLKAFLKTRSDIERKGLQKLLGADSHSAKGLAAALIESSTSVLNRWFGDEPTYYQIVQSVARKLQIEADNGDSVEFLECEIVKHLFETIWKKLTPKQREDLQRQIEEALGEDRGTFAFKTGAAFFAAITAANLSGFGIYVLSTTVLGALSGALSITLPFAFYTILTRGISIATGPVGVAIATALTLYQFTGPNWKKTTMAIAYISMLRNAPASQLLQK